MALTFAHFSSELLLNEQMIIPVKKNWSILAKFAKKKPSEIGCFLLIVSWQSFPPKFPVKSADSPKKFLGNYLPLKILRKLTFSAKNPWNGPIFLRILTFLPRKSPEFGRLFREFWFFSRENPAKLADFPRICPWKSCEILLFFPRNIRSPVHECLGLEKVVIISH